MLKAAARRALGPIGLALDTIDLALWMKKQLPDMQSYFDPPKLLEELQKAVDDPVVGYEIHHIVEQTSVREDGFPDSMIDSRENTVRISSWKHREITAWYQAKSEDFGDLSPREYLRGKSWEERMEIGLKALADHEVLKR